MESPIGRTYHLEVVAKWYGTHNFGSITLRRPSVNQQELMINLPWWIDHTNTGAPVTLDLTPEEMSQVSVGDLFEVTLKGVK